MNYKIEGNGEILVFIHGLSDNLLYWEFLANSLMDDYRILRMDLRGHGDSELGNDEITMDVYVNDLKNLLDELNIKKINLVGFSLGGAVALDFTIKHPDYVSSIVLMSTFFKCDEYSSNVLIQLRDALESSFEDFYDLILPMILCPDVIDENSVDLEMLKETAAKTADTKAYVKAVNACLNFDVEDRLSEISCPALIFAGKYDELFTLDAQIELKNRIENSKLIVLDNAKHNLLVGENNLEVLNALRDFL